MDDRVLLTAAAEEAGVRLDVFLASRLPELTRSRARDLVLAGRVLVGGVGARPSRRLAEGDIVTFEVLSPQVTGPIEAVAELPLAVIHADDALLVIDKAPGQVAHPAPGHGADTLVNALLARYPDLANVEQGQRPGIVHRLDRDTSGVMVVARTSAAAANLRAQFKARTIEKTYLAIVRGAVSPPQGVIDAPIGRDPARRQRMAVLAGGREARTLYRVLGQVEGYALVQAEPRSGRTHQIRVHLAAVGHPVVGDSVYGRRDPRIARSALHAWRLVLDHPATGTRMAFEAPLPSDMRAALEGLGLVPPAACTT